MEPRCGPGPRGRMAADVVDGGPLRARCRHGQRLPGDTWRWAPWHGLLQVQAQGRSGEAAPAQETEPQVRLGTTTSRTSSRRRGGGAQQAAPFPSLLGEGCPCFFEDSRVEGACSLEISLSPTTSWREHRNSRQKGALSASVPPSMCNPRRPASRNILQEASLAGSNGTGKIFTCGADCRTKLSLRSRRTRRGHFNFSNKGIHFFLCGLMVLSTETHSKYTYVCILKRHLVYLELK